MSALHDLSALEQAAAVQTGVCSSVDLVEHYAARVLAHDETVGAFVTRTLDTARAQARSADDALRSRAEVPPLHGVPIGIKDLNLTAGVPTRFGSSVFSELVPAVSDFVVDALREAGTISLGKTNTPELGLPCYTEPDVAPPARTPWDLDRSAGGSSGGAAAAVAAGLLPFAQGSDGGGSIRIPASACGLFGLKPARGRISAGPVAADVSGLGVNGPLTRTVRDAAALLDAMAGPRPGDPHWAAPPAQSFLAACEQEPGRLRIGRYCASALAVAGVDPEVLAGWEAASALLVELGHDVEDIASPFDAALVPSFETVWSVSAASSPVDPAREDELQPLTRWLRGRGRATTAPEFVAALGELQRASRRAILATADYDVVLTPTLAGLPAPVGWFTAAGDPRSEFDRMIGWTPFTAVYNTSGQPAASVPLHHTAGGLPVGVQLVGRPADEATLLRLSAQLEQALPWRDRHPAIWSAA